MDNSPFNEMVKSKLGVYVYALLDPRIKATIRERVFYVGKGTANRAFNYAKIARAIDDTPGSYNNT